MRRDPNQLSFFDDEIVEEPVQQAPKWQSKKPKRFWHIYAVDKFDRTMEDDIEAVSWKQAVFFFKKKHGQYWSCHP